MGNAESQPSTRNSVREERVEWHPLELEDHPLDTPAHIKVIVVGAGIAGINAAILLPAKVPGIELIIYERESNIGGVWHQCVYPGVRCDVPSHVYQSTFAPSTEWSEHYAPGSEIEAYWQNVAKKYDAQKYIHCNHEVFSAEWNEDKDKWFVTVKHGNLTTINEADHVIMATGIFSHPKLPKFVGMEDYKGHFCHSSRWDPDFDAKGKNIAIIGNGSSGLQVLPYLQKVAGRIDHYVRSPTWVGGAFGPKYDAGENKISDELRESFGDAETYLKYRKGLENPSFSGFSSTAKDGAKSKMNREIFSNDMRRRLGDRTDLLEVIQPDFSPSCRRLTPGPGYLEALTQPNVEYITTGIEKLTATGLRTIDGKERQVDAIICCTGSGNSFVPPFPVICGGVDLASDWKPDGSIGFPKTYLGVAAPGFPNLFFVNGPTAAAATGTLPLATENQITFIARVLRKVSSQDIRSISPTLQATEDFRAYCEAYFPRTVMSEDCSSWFNGGIKGGRVIAMWPGSGLHANAVRREPRWEDWTYTYKSSSRNRFAYFGNGWTQKDVEVNQESAQAAHLEVDLTPYLHKDALTGKLDLRDYHESWYKV